MRTFKMVNVVAAGIVLVLVTTVLAQDKSAAELAQALKSADVAARVEACRELGKMGTAARVAVPELIDAVKTTGQPDLQKAAALALGAIGLEAKEAVPALMEQLKSDDAQVRAYAAHALGEMGTAAGDSAVALIERITDEDPAVRREARDSLRAIHPPQEVIIQNMPRILKAATPADAAAAVMTIAELGEAAVPGLCEALADDEACFWAALALSEIGEKAQAAVPGLGKLLRHKDPEVRMQALVALAEIGPPSKPLAGQITQILNEDKEPSVQYAAAYALGMIGDLNTARDSLEKAMGSRDPFLKVASAWALLRLAHGRTPFLRQAVRNVLEGLKSDNPDVRAAAARALADPDVPQDVLVPAFRAAMEGLKSDAPEKLMPIVEALSTLGKRVVPPCIQALEEKRPLRFYALQVLIRIGADAAPAVPAIAATLEDPDADLRRESLYALGAIGAESAKATDQIMAKLNDQDAEVRYAACYALGKIGPEARQALPELTKLMDSDDEFMQIASVWAALKISPDDADLRQKALPKLVKAMGDPREHVRIEAAYTLGELGMDNDSVKEALQKALDDSSSAVREAARSALDQLK